MKTDDDVARDIAREFVARWCPIVSTVVWLMTRESADEPFEIKRLTGVEIGDEILGAMTRGKTAH